MPCHLFLVLSGRAGGRWSHAACIIQTKCFPPSFEISVSSPSIDVILLAVLRNRNYNEIAALRCFSRIYAFSTCNLPGESMLVSTVQYTRI
ncbi:histone H4, partial [Histoplasma capsulatum H143]